MHVWMKILIIQKLTSVDRYIAREYRRKSLTVLLVQEELA